MITAIVQFELPQPITVKEARAVFSGTAPKYLEVRGLIRKFYLLADDGRTAGGVYLWKSRHDAESFYTAEWKQFIQKKYGTTPQVTIFESPVVIDNTTSTITADA